MKTKSQIFDFSRFIDCIKRDLTLNSRQWLLRALMMLGVTTLLLMIGTSPHDNMNAAVYDNLFQSKTGFTIFRFCGTVFCALGASLFMENMTSNGLRLNSLMSPASSLEKFLSRWVICVFGVTIAYLICFALADLIRVAIFTWYYDDVPGLRYYGPFEMMQKAEHWYYLWGSLASVQAVFVLGSTVTPKNAFLKTFGIMLVLIIAFGIIVGNVFAALEPFGSHIIAKNGPTSVLDTAAKISPIFWMLFCYITAYFRLKESEIINRL